MQQDLFARPQKIVLHLKGLPPSFKNNKMLIAKTPRGVPLAHPILITKPEFQERMEAIIQCFVSQLKSIFQPTGGKTQTGFSLQSAIALSVPEDDSLPYLRGGITVLPIKVERIEDEGVRITVERLS